MNPAPVALIGLGAMGTALGRTLLAHGHPLTAWNRSPGKAAALTGAAVASTAAEAATAGRLVILCVTDYAAGRAVLDTVGDALSGRTLVNLATGTPDEARAMGAWAARRGADYIDGVFQAMPAQIGTADAGMLYAGSRSAFDVHAPTLGLLGTATFVGSDAGQACLYDMALLGLWYEAEIAYLNALALVRGADVDPETFVPFATRQLTYVVDALPEVAREVRAGRYPRGPATLAEHARVLDQLVQVRREGGMNVDQLEHIRSLTGQVIAAGGRSDGFTALSPALAGARPATGQQDVIRR